MKEENVKLDIGYKVRISDITMTCTVVKRDFQGEFYTMVYFSGGELKCLDFSGGELEALGARMVEEGQPKAKLEKRPTDRAGQNPDGEGCAREAGGTTEMTGTMEAREE